MDEVTEGNGSTPVVGAPGRRPGRGDGRAALLAAGATLAGTGTLADYLGFVAVQDVAARAGVSTGLLYHHFPIRAGGGGGAAFLAAVAETLLLPAPISERTFAAVAQAADQFADGDADAALETISTAAGDDVEEHARGIGATALSVSLVVAAAAPWDPVARRVLRASYDAMEALHVASYEALLAAWGREVRPPFTTPTLAMAITAITDGWATRMRIDDRATPALFAEAVKLLVAVGTAPIADPDPSTADELLGGRGAQQGPPATAAIAGAAVELYERGGWPRVTVPAVAAMTGLDARIVKASVGSREALAGIVWARFLERLGGALHADRTGGATMAVAVAAHLRRVADVVDRHRALTVAWVASAGAVASAAVARGEAPTDPRTGVPLVALLADLLAGHASAFRPALAVDTDAGATALATLLTDSVVRLALARPGDPPAEVAAYVCAVCLDGAMAPTDGAG